MSATTIANLSEASTFDKAGFLPEVTQVFRA